MLLVVLLGNASLTLSPVGNDLTQFGWEIEPTYSTLNSRSQVEYMYMCSSQAPCVWGGTFNSKIQAQNDSVVFSFTPSSYVTGQKRKTARTNRAHLKPEHRCNDERRHQSNSNDKIHHHQYNKSYHTSISSPKIILINTWYLQIIHHSIKLIYGKASIILQRKKNFDYFR